MGGEARQGNESNKDRLIDIEWNININNIDKAWIEVYCLPKLCRLPIRHDPFVAVSRIENASGQGQ